MIMALKCVAHAARWLGRIGAAQIALAGIIGVASVVCAAQTLQGPDRIPIAQLGGELTLEDGQTATRTVGGGWLLIGGSRNPAQLIIEDVQGTSGRAANVRLAYPRKNHSSTLLPDGSVLIIGGISASDGSAVAIVERFDPQRESLTAIENSGLQPRANHSATVMLDGRVLIVGGNDVAGQPVLQAELYDPNNGEVELISAQLDRGRLRHIASHLQTDEVLLWKGTDSEGRPLASGSLFDTLTQYFSEISAEGIDRKLTDLDADDDAPKVLKSIPGAHERHAAINRPLVVQFSRPMEVASLNKTSVVLFGPNGPTRIQVVPVENGRLLFVTAQGDLMPGATYTLFLNDARDARGRSLGLTAITFSTEVLVGAADRASSVTATGGPSGNGTTGSVRRSSSVAQVDPRNGDQSLQRYQSPGLNAPSSQAGTPGDMASAALDINLDRWVPTQNNLRGDWRSGRKHQAHFARAKNEWLNRALHGHPEIKARMGKFTPATVSRQALAALVPSRFLRPERGPTALMGQVVKLDGQPLPGVRISIGARLTVTDSDGEFLIENAPSGRQVVVIDGSSGRYERRQYGRYEYGVDIVANQRNILPFKIWLTELDAANALNIASPTTALTVLTNPAIPGLELRIPVGTVIRDADGKVVTRITMTPIPIDQAPFPLPNFDVPVYFTIQPGGAHFEASAGGVHPGAQLIYPNFSRARPGTRMRFWNYDVNRGWHEYGKGTVSADGQRIVPDPGVVIHEFSGAMVSDPDNAPTEWPRECKRADPVDCFTGLFINEGVDLVVTDVIPLEVRRTYRNRDDTSRSFGLGTNLSYDFFIVGDTESNGGAYTFQELILPDGEHIYYPRISPGTGAEDAVYQNTSSPGKYYGSIIQWGSPAWELTLRDGTIYRFIDSVDSNDPRMAAVHEIEDRHGNELILTRGANYELTRIASPSGRYIEFDYDQENRVTAAHDDIGRTVQYEYDVQGRLIEVTDQNSNTEEFTYDSANNMLTVTDKRGNVKVTNTFDANDRVATQTYADNSTSSFAYTLDTNGAVTQTDFTDQRNVVTRFVFNANGHPTAITLALGLTEEKTWTINRSGATNLVSSVIDPLGRTTTWAYDAIGNVTEHVRLAGTANALTTSIEYSALSRPTEVTVGGRTTVLNYNTVGDLEEIIDPLGHTRSFTYDARGRILTGTNGNDVTVATYSYLGGGSVSVTDALGHSSTMEMDSTTSLVGTNPLGARTSLSYNTLGKVAEVVDPNGGSIQFEYDANGNMLEHEDANDNSTSFSYDVMNRLSSKTDSYSNADSFLYDPAGALTRRVDRKGQVSGISYDNLGRPAAMGYGATVSNPTAYSRTVTNTWDAANRLIQMVDSVSGTITRTYDGLDNLLSESTPQGIVNYTYDATGRRATMTVQGEPTVSYQWDDADRLVQMQQAAGASNGNVAQTITFTYDDANRRTTTTLANGIEASYVYDDADRVTEINIVASNSQTIGNLTYTYDAAGKRTSVGGSLANVDLPAAIASALYGANNELLEWDGVTYSYDDNGNLLSDGARTFSWDEKDQLTSISGSATGTFEYDAIGRRIGRVVNSNALGYIFDGSNIVQEKSGTSAQASVIANLLVGGIDHVYARMQNGSVTTMLADAQGSILAETNASEAITSSYTYGAYGETVASGTSTGNTQQYVGRENDGTGLYYYRARYYSPQSARFIAEDPIGWASGQANNYGYVGADPINRTDPFGLWSFILEGYRGFGGAIYFGQQPGTEGWANNWFFRVRVGFGIGGGWAIDPADNDPAQDIAMSEGACSSSGSAAGWFGEWNLTLPRATRISAGQEAQAGAYSASRPGFYADVGPSGSFGSTGTRGSASTGFEFGGFTCECAK